MEVLKPNLIEPSTKYYIKHALKESRKLKDYYINMTVNILLFIFFGLFIGGLLLYKYKGKLTPEELKKKENEKKMFLMKKMQQFSVEKEKLNQNLITNLPLNHPEINLM
jgi:hypothetical protein